MKKGLALLSIFAGLVLILFVSAAVTIGSPAQYGNYSGTVNVSITTDLPEALNVSVYYNSSGGAVDTSGSPLSTIFNDTNSDTLFENTSVDVSGLSDGSSYNFTFVVANSTDTELSSVSDVTVDNTPPAVVISNISSPVDYGNYSDNETLLLNVTLTDALLEVSSVFFNITNSSGDQNATYTATNSGTSWNASMNVSDFPDGDYNVTVWANDSVNNINNSAYVQITIDNTDPSVGLSLTSAGSSTITLSVGASDSRSGVYTTCSSSRSGASISGNSTTQTLTESELDCGNDYSYTVSCTDLAGNVGSSSISVSTEGCGSSGSGSSSTSSTVSWRHEYTHKSSEFSELVEVSENLSAKERISLMISGKTHYVGVKSISGEEVTVIVQSDPQEATIAVGEEKRFDVDGDGVYDVVVVVDSVENDKATIILKSIEEVVEEGSEDDVEGSGGEEGSGEDGEGSGDGFGTIGFIVIVILIIAAAVGFGYSKKRK